jgi:hypothetical protein
MAVKKTLEEEEKKEEEGDGNFVAIAFFATL